MFYIKFTKKFIAGFKHSETSVVPILVGVSAGWSIFSWVSLHLLTHAFNTSWSDDVCSHPRIISG